MFDDLSYIVRVRKALRNAEREVLILPECGRRLVETLLIRRLFVVVFLIGPQRMEPTEAGHRRVRARRLWWGRRHRRTAYVLTAGQFGDVREVELEFAKVWRRELESVPVLRLWPTLDLSDVGRAVDLSRPALNGRWVRLHSRFITLIVAIIIYLLMNGRKLVFNVSFIRELFVLFIICDYLCLVFSILLILHENRLLFRVGSTQLIGVRQPSGRRSRAFGPKHLQNVGLIGVVVLLEALTELRRSGRTDHTYGQT